MFKTSAQEYRGPFLYLLNLFGSFLDRHFKILIKQCNSGELNKKGIFLPPKTIVNAQRMRFCPLYFE